MINRKLFRYKNARDGLEFEINREFQKRVIVGDILWFLHQKQGTQAWLVQAIEPYLRKEDRPLFGLV